MKGPQIFAAILLTSLSMAGTNTVSAADDINVQINGQSYQCSGSSDGQYVQVTSEVDLACVTWLRARYPYTPDDKMIIGWAGDCRSAPVSQNHCFVTSNKLDTACFDKLKSLYPYTLDQTQVAGFSEACRRVQQTCGFKDK